MLSEEEKKAVKTLERIKNMKFNITSSFYSSGTISLSIEEKEAIETVINELEYKQDDINVLQAQRDSVENQLKQAKAELEKKDNLINEQLKENVKVQNELNEENNRCMILANNDKFKEQMIDLMAEELVKAHEWFYSEFDNFTKEDFIEYFTKKVEDK